MSNMDREAREQYLVVVLVKDMLGLNGGYSASTTVTISLTDVNDNGPTFQHKQNHLSLSVVLFVKVLDIKDNAPRLARDYQPYICDGTQSGELIQLISAVDLDNLWRDTISISPWSMRSTSTPTLPSGTTKVEYR
eukprot:XP_014013340.1 PREDICTED: cadherin-7-like [Salmo salar]